MDHRSTIFTHTPLFTYPAQKCLIWNIYKSVSTALIVLAVDFNLFLRSMCTFLFQRSKYLIVPVFALYHRNRIVRVIVVALFVVQVTMATLGVALAVPKIVANNRCTGIHSLSWAMLLSA